MIIGQVQDYCFYLFETVTMQKYMCAQRVNVLA